MPSLISYAVVGVAAAASILPDADSEAVWIWLPRALLVVAVRFLRSCFA